MVIILINILKKAKKLILVLTIFISIIINNKKL